MTSKVDMYDGSDLEVQSPVVKMYSGFAGERRLW